LKVSPFSKKGLVGKSWPADLVDCDWELAGFKADSGVHRVVFFALRDVVACVHNECRLSSHDLHRPALTHQFPCHVHSGVRIWVYSHYVGVVNAGLASTVNRPTKSVFTSNFLQVVEVK